MNTSNPTSRRSTMEHIDRKAWERINPPKPYQSRFVESFLRDDIPGQSAPVLAPKSQNTNATLQVESGSSIQAKHEKHSNFSQSLAHSVARMIHGAKKHRSKSVPVHDKDACRVEEFLALANYRSKNDSSVSLPARNFPKQWPSVGSSRNASLVISDAR
ncbi:hypothetical protein PMIN01_07808 [Paraphaeosphaeria minitans]|uniref:Uncharacterized protein n=1 Tax=Paraphaeosphaeria minitans TaxID=565426 RepID=A0A9P6KQA6_9PLEO|nr:hypothetical protein PMIN01_07808 [Paraphaeosphaeria minitans]